MNKEMRELLNKINAKKAEIKALVADKKLEEAKAAKEELREMQDSFNILADLEDDEQQQAQQAAENGDAQVAGEEKTDLQSRLRRSQMLLRQRGNTRA